MRQGIRVVSVCVIAFTMITILGAATCRAQTIAAPSTQAASTTPSAQPNSIGQAAVDSGTPAPPPTISATAPTTQAIVAPPAPRQPIPMRPAVLPGAGLAQHSFLYTGEWDHRFPVQTIFLVRGGKVVWTYQIPIKDASGTLQELGDATMLANGNILFCRKVGASEITPNKKIVWNIDSPKGCEIHSVQPLGLDRVLIVENGNPAKMLIINTTTGATEKELDLPTAHPTRAHLQFRRVRQTKAGTFLAAELDNNKVVELDPDGKVIWSVVAPAPWSAVRLDNGNTLIGCSTRGVREVDTAGKTVWSFTQKDMPSIKMFIIQDVVRLSNGDTVMCNWCPSSFKDTRKWDNTVQLIEATPDKKIVWAVSEWKDPTDLGPASSIQFLDEPGAPDLKAYPAP